MSWFDVLFFVALAVVSGVLAVMFGADPEGRGAAIAEWLMSGALLAVLMAFILSMCLLGRG